jgi:hypothetical protein
MRRQGSTGERGCKVASGLPRFLGDIFLVDADPPDPDYRQRYAADAIGGFRMLSLILCGTIAAMSLVPVMRWSTSSIGRPDTSVSFLTSAVLAVAGIVGFWASKFILGPGVAFLAAAGLLGAAVWAITTDRLLLSAKAAVPTPSLIPVIFPVLMLSVTEAQDVTAARRAEIGCCLWHVTDSAADSSTREEK